MSEIIILDENSSEQTKSVHNSVGLFEKFNDYLISQSKIKIGQKTIFYRLIATMVDAGLPLLKSTSILAKQEQDPVLKRILETIQSDLRSGASLSKSLRLNRSFSDAECSIIESGEKTGRLNTSLIQLADQMESTDRLNKKLKGALIYPLFIIIAMVTSVVVIMTLVIPNIVALFPDPEKLPALTKFLIAISDAMVASWYYGVIIILVSGILFSLWKRTPAGMYYFDKILLRLPIFGPLILKVVISKFSRVLSTLIRSGISIVESMRIVSQVVDNEVYRQRILLLREDIKRGIKIGDSIEDDSLFPEIFVQMVKVGEETATLDKIILKIAAFYDDDVEQTIGNMNKLIEPIIIVVMGAVIGLIAVGVLSPIFQLSDVISQQ